MVPIILGSRADLEHGQAVAVALLAFGVESEIRIASAHKAPEFLMKILADYEADPRPKVYVTIAGLSNALSAFTDGRVAAPVIACPPYSEKFGGADLFSSLRMPSGIAPMVVLTPAGAALAAAKILALTDADIAERIRAVQGATAARIEADDAALRPR
ncbi:MAG: AIR carboxylase family protein [Myxococcales bacterium]|nr:AIR carboxylase family protein [Myxococcales bacterium]